jgi:hypothetical protein
MKALVATIALLCLSSTAIAHDIYSNLRDAAGHLCWIVSQLRLRCCRMGPTIYQRVMKLFLPTWHQHRLMIAFTIVPIIQ